MRLPCHDYDNKPIVETARRSQKGQVLLVFLWSFAEYGFRKVLRLKAQGVYSSKWRGLNVDNNAASAAQCKGLLISTTPTSPAYSTLKYIAPIIQ